MSSYCEDCGCKKYGNRCTNCNEELFIVDQYIELDMPLPNDNTLFMQKVIEHEKIINKKSCL